MDQTGIFNLETVEDLRRAFGADALRELLTLYLRESERDFQRLGAAVAAGSASAAKDYSHRIKGAAGSVGAERVQFYAAAVEALARVGALHLLPPIVEGLGAAMDQTRANAQTIG